MSGLKETAEELKKNAEENPVDISRGISFASHRRLVNVEGFVVIIIFTLDMIGCRRMWHLSIRDQDSNNPLPEKIVGIVKKEFFDKGESEVPSIKHGDKVRQFVKFVEVKRND